MWINYQFMAVCPLILNFCTYLPKNGLVSIIILASQIFYPNWPIFLHGYIRNIRDIFHLWNYVVFFGTTKSREKSSLKNLWTHFRHGCGLAVDGGASLDWRECRLLKPLLSPWLHPAHCSDDHNQANNWPIFSPKLPFWSKVASFALKYQTHWVNSRSQGDD